jgi:hypothetical protein
VSETTLRMCLCLLPVLLIRITILVVGLVNYANHFQLGPRSIRLQRQTFAPAGMKKQRPVYNRGACAVKDLWRTDATKACLTCDCDHQLQGRILGVAAVITMQGSSNKHHLYILRTATLLQAVSVFGIYTPSR